MTYIGELQIPDDLFSENRRSKGYFLRVTAWNDDVKYLVHKCIVTAGKSGGKIENEFAVPNQAETDECLNGARHEFAVTKECVLSWLSGYLHTDLPENIAIAVADVLHEIKAMGKNDCIVKNVFVKMMFWFKKYAFGAMKSAAAGEHPMIFCCVKTISRYEVMFLYALSEGGYDVVTAERDGGESYKKADPEEKYSSLLSVSHGGEFPADITGKGGTSVSGSKNNQAESSTGSLCVNAWISGEIFRDIAVPAERRGSDPNVFYTCFARVNGAENRSSYSNEIYSLYTGESEKRSVLVFDRAVDNPENEEIANVRRGNYRDVESLIRDMSANFVHSYQKFQEMMKKAFEETITEFYENTPELRKALNMAVYIICWLKRYQGTLFSDIKNKNIPLVIILNGCKNEREAYFVKFLSKLPVDILILMPNLGDKCLLSDKFLYERNFTDTLTLEEFPKSAASTQQGTAAYYAERDIDSMIHTADTGLFRSYSFDTAETFVLKTMYEEIKILWGQELKYRPNFSAGGDMVRIPVIMAKISGVKNKDTIEYWNGIVDLINMDKSVKVICNRRVTENVYGCESAVDMIKGGRLRTDIIKKSRDYKYGFLKAETQDYILGAVQRLIDSGMISYENGSVYKVISVGLSLGEDILRRVQTFDFTKKNPKFIYINTTKDIISLEDSIYLALLSFLGFDVLLFIPTGYSSADRYYSPGTMVSHQTGDYMFDLEVPDLTKKQFSAKAFIGKILGNK
jgi:hypothetical protein